MSEYNQGKEELKKSRVVGYFVQIIRMEYISVVNKIPLYVMKSNFIVNSHVTFCALTSLKTNRIFCMEKLKEKYHKTYKLVNNRRLRMQIIVNRSPS